ncbi:AAA family ATPase [Candidatus Woesearchaeota archaeon]|nr:AAA family ATPase [Candidatus Woesearchaeota archaeon]
MSIFDEMLKSDETLFRDAVALDYDFIPKLIPYREKEQKHIALCIKPLFQRRTGKNIMVYGAPGIGKTVAVKHIFKELEEKTDEIIPIYVNCWQKNTSFKIAMEICEILDYRFTHNKKTDELFKVISTILNKKSAVFCFDEIDKAEEQDFLYTLLEEIYRKTIILITNYKTWVLELEDRLKSRLMLEFLEFKEYSPEETKGILRERLRYAFVDGVWEDDGFNLAARKTAELKDIRAGLYLLREAGNAAEDKASKKITLEHVKTALNKLSDFNIKKSTELKEDERFILSIVKKNSGKKSGELYEIFKKNGGQGVYRTFQRKIDFLAKSKFISVTKTLGGPEGTTSIIKYERDAKLSDY